MNWTSFAQDILNGHQVGRDEAMAVLNSTDSELLDVLHGAYLLRERYWGRGVRLHVLQNAKSGVCRENCAFCSQAMGAYSDVERYRMQSIDELVAGAREAYRNNAVKYCMVTASRGPSDADLFTICEATRQIKAEMPLTICASLGLLKDEQARTLKEAGVDRFNHNLESSSSFYPEVCQTHTWEDRLETIRAVKRNGLEACCGGIMGMGETLEDRVDLALTLQEIGVESIPVNFLDPRPGTPLEHLKRLTPNHCLRALAMFRYTNPESEIRCAGGREVCLRHVQALALYPANSMFTEGYLTTGGQEQSEDVAMIEEAGFFVEQLVESKPDEMVEAHAKAQSSTK